MNDPRHWPLHRVVAIVAFTAFVVRILYLLECAGQPWFGAPVLDARYLLDHAQHLVRTGAFPAGPFFRPPGYALFLAPWVALAPNHAVEVVAVVQALMGTVLCALLTVTTARATNSPIAGAAAGILAALCGPFVFYEGEPVGDSLGLFLTGLSFLTFERLRRSLTPWACAAAGCAVAAAISVRPNLLLLAAGLVLLLVVVLWQPTGRLASLFGFPALSPAAPRQKLLAPACFALPVALGVLIPSVRNLAAGDWNLVCSQGGINFYIGNCPEANGTNIILPRVATIPGDYRDYVEEYAKLGYLQATLGTQPGELAYRAADTSVKPSDISRYWYGEGRRFLVSQPARAVALYARKVIALLNNREVRNNRDFQFTKTNVSTVLKLLPVTFGVLFTFSVLAVLSAIRTSGPTRTTVLLVLLMQSMIAAGLLPFFLGGRLRLPFALGMVVLAGIGVAALIDWIRSKNKRDLLTAAIVAPIAVAFTFSNWSILDYRIRPEQQAGLGLAATTHDASDLTFLATASLDNGNAAAALDFATRAYKADPTMTFPRLVAGNAALALGKADLAEVQYSVFLAAEPSSVAALNNRGVALELLNRFDEAVECYRESLAVEKRNPTALGNLAMLGLRSDDTSAALDLAQQALQIDSRSVQALAVLEVLGKVPNGTAPARLKQEALTSLAPHNRHLISKPLPQQKPNP